MRNPQDTKQTSNKLGRLHKIMKGKGKNTLEETLTFQCWYVQREGQGEDLGSGRCWVAMGGGG